MNKGTGQIQKRVLCMFLFVAIGIATFFIYDQVTTGALFRDTDPSPINQGLNEYKDPSKNPKYYQRHNTIMFTESGLSSAEWTQLNSLVNLQDNPIEEPDLWVNGNYIPLSQLKEEDKVGGIRFNSNLEDTRVFELNYYRGRNEVLDNLRRQRQILKSKGQLNPKDQEAEQKLNTNIREIELVIERNKKNWDKKAREQSAAVNLVKAKIGFTTTSPNKDLMDVLYPSQERIDEINREILEERRQIEELQLDKIWKREEEQKLLNRILPEVRAEYLNNFVTSLVVYSRSNLGLRLDLKGNGVYNGNTFHLWQANGGNAQKFRFIDETGEIKYAANESFCLDIDLANGQYDNGDKVHLWTCHGGTNQKWAAYPSGEIKPLVNLNYCLDASAGVSQGSTFHLWQCHGGSNQRFQIGEEDFGQFQYHMRIHSSTTLSSGDNVTGHALISMPKKELANNYWHITNSFGFWGGDSNRDSNAVNWNGGRTNNMRNFTSSYQWSLLNVDGGKNNDFDWQVAVAHPADAGGEFGGYRRTTATVSKQKYEEVKYMRGYQTDNVNQGQNYVSSNWTPACTTCSTYAISVWNIHTEATDYGWCWTPFQLYIVL